jgi:hypothetical protein
MDSFPKIGMIRIPRRINAVSFLPVVYCDLLVRPVSSQMQTVECSMCTATSASEPNMESLIEQLSGAKKAHMSWMDVGAIFQKISLHAGPNRARMEQDAAAASGYSVGVLKRFVVALNFVESPYLPEMEKPKRQVLESSFTAIELIERISRQNPTRATELMGQLGRRGTRVEVIRDELAAMRGGYQGSAIPYIRTTPPVSPIVQPVGNARAHSASARRNREEITFEGVENLLPQLSGKFHEFHRPIGVPIAPLRCDAIAWLDKRMEAADGFEFLYAPSSMTEVLFSDQLCRAFVASSFFRRHFIVFTEDSDSKFPERAVQILKVLQMDSLGVIALAEREPVRLMPKARSKDSPDRRALLSLLCPRGRWAESLDKAS